MRSFDRDRREFLTGSAAAMLAAGCWPGRAAGAMDHASVHGMLIVGEQTVFLSHLPLFGSPHDFQVLLEATFSKPGDDPQSDYFNSRKSSGEKIYTLEPEPFVLPTLAAATPLRSFKANIYRGHFERFPNRRAQDAGRIGQGVDVTVTRILHFRKFDPTAAKLPALEYLLFGKGDELFLAHFITAPPDFDQVLSVKAPGEKFSDADLSRAMPVVMSGRPNTVAQRIKGGEAVTGQLQEAGGAAAKAVQLQAGTEFYLEQEELAS
jgi:hypothetical protein